MSIAGMVADARQIVSLGLEGGSGVKIFDGATAANGSLCLETLCQGRARSEATPHDSKESCHPSFVFEMCTGQAALLTSGHVPMKRHSHTQAISECVGGSACARAAPFEWHSMNCRDASIFLVLRSLIASWVLVSCFHSD